MPNWSNIRLQVVPNWSNIRLQWCLIDQTLGYKWCLIVWESIDKIKRTVQSLLINRVAGSINKGTHRRFQLQLLYSVMCTYLLYQTMAKVVRTNYFSQVRKTTICIIDPTKMIKRVEQGMLWFKFSQYRECLQKNLVQILEIHFFNSNIFDFHWYLNTHWFPCFY